MTAPASKKNIFTNPMFIVGAIAVIGSLCFGLLCVCAIVFAVASGGFSQITARANPITAQQVMDKFKAAGLKVEDVHREERDPKSPLPNSYKDRLVFAVPEVAPKGGQVLVCSTKQNCDAIFVYFQAIKGLGGPYIYQSANGTVVLQLNKGLKPDVADKFEAVIKSLP